MRNHQISSPKQSPSSAVVRRFVDRAGFGEGCKPEDVMARLIEATRRRRVKARDKQLQLFLRDRNVWETEVVSDLPCDGLIEPIGTTYGAGFRMRLKKNAADVRLRFTIAHELCHTFFYELVPELKFV